MRIYLAGPMRGYPHFNFPAFDHATFFLRAEGHEVFSPAERDRKQYPQIEWNTNSSIAVAEEADGFSLREALAADISWICLHAEAIALLPGWEKSAGARAEWATGVALGLKFFYLDNYYAL